MAYGVEVEAANLMRREARHVFDAHQPCGAPACLDKRLPAKAGRYAADAALRCHDGSASEVDMQRKIQETRQYQKARISTHLMPTDVAERLLEPPQTF